MPDVQIKSADGGAFSAYLSVPARPKGPAVITMQQIFGVNAEMRGYTDDFAAHGYFAICPDLFWRQQPNVQLTPGTPEALEQAMTFNRGLDIDKAVEDLKATLAFIRAYPGCNGKTATVGYCLGGLTAYLMAVRSDAECNVSYFGVGIEKWINEAVNLRKPLMLHVPENDRTVPPDAQAIIRKGVKGRAEFYAYPNADHAFNRVGSRSYDKAVTDLAYDRTAEFLRRYLGS
jgi:carboxymethylenebutenolidase